MALVSEARIRTVCLVIIAAVLGAMALMHLKPALIPFMLAVLLTYAVAPGVDFLTDRLRCPRIVAIGLALVIGFGAFTLLAALVASSVGRLGEKAPEYQAHFQSLVERGAAWLSAQGVQIDQAGIGDKLKQSLPFEQWAAAAGKGITNIVSNTFLVLVFAVYLLLGHRSSADGKAPLRAAIESRIERYVTMKVALSAATGVAVWLILAVLGVDLALVFGVLTFVLNFIPNIGSLIAMALPVPIVVFGDYSAAVVVLAIVLPGTVQMLVGNVIEPKIMGDSLELHPVTILLALVFWGILWGIPGMLLATPITAVAKILMAEVELTRPVADLMGGRLPGDPVNDPERPAPPPAAESTPPPPDPPE